jgi:D-alanine-D-alanine ligase
MQRNTSARAHKQRAPARQIRTAEIIALQGAIEQLLPRLRIAVIFGGDKRGAGSVVYEAGNTRSWKSYQAVAEDIADSLRRIGCGHVEVVPEDMRLAERLRRSGIHMAWLNTGGVQGYNSAAHASAMLEMLGIPYVGHDPLAATTLDNKHAFKREAVCAGLPTAPFSTWHSARGPFLPDLNSRFMQAFGDYPGPFVVKPVSGRASLHVHVVPDRQSLSDAVAEVYEHTENVVLIEKYLAGREFCIAAGGPIIAHGKTISHLGQPFTFAVLERSFAPDELIFTSMDFKPITADRFKHVDQKRDPALWAKLHHLARDVFLEFNLRSLIRIDMRADENGDVYILEANPKPDLKRPDKAATSLISAGLSQAGLDYDDLILSLLADRLATLLGRGARTASHISELLDSCSTNVAKLSHDSTSSGNTDDMVLALEEKSRQMRLYEISD